MGEGQVRPSCTIHALARTLSTLLWPICVDIVMHESGDASAWQHCVLDVGHDCFLGLSHSQHCWKLKLVKNLMRITTVCPMSVSVAVLLIENGGAKQSDSPRIVDAFAQKKATKIWLRHIGLMSIASTENWKWKTTLPNTTVVHTKASGLCRLTVKSS